MIAKAELAHLFPCRALSDRELGPQLPSHLKSAVLTRDSDAVIVALDSEPDRQLYEKIQSTLECRICRIAAVHLTFLR